MIFVCTYKGSPFLHECLSSIPSGIPTIVIRGYHYECGALRWIQSNYSGEEFLFLQDSTKIKNPQWLYDIFEKRGTSISLNYEPGWFGMYMGKYRREIFSQLILPCTESKMDAVLAEMQVGKAYEKLEKSMEILWPDLTLDKATPDHIHGRDVMRYENDHFIKYKSTWNGNLIDPAEDRDQKIRNNNP